MYKSPIEIVYGEMQSQIQTQLEGDVIKTVQKYGIFVNKDELVKALAYDRNQYNEGYRDAMATIVRCEECKYKDDCARQMVHTTRDHVLEQNISTYNKVDYCSFGVRKE